MFRNECTMLCFNMPSDIEQNVDIRVSLSINQKKYGGLSFCLQIQTV